MAVPERVVISGAGCCTALGHDLDSVARSLREGRDAFRASGALEGLSVCPAEDWGQDGARQQFEGWRHRHYLNRGSRMAVLSGLRALRDAGLEAGLPVRSQIIAAVGPMLDVTGEPGLPPQDTATLGALWLLRWLPNTAAGALALSLGIAIQNFPEGAIISMPLRAEGMKKGRAFWGGVLSGIVEPIGAVLTILAAGIVVPALPYLLSFAAGAMLYVVVEELIPEMSQGQHSNVGTVFFAVGFSVMMVLDVALG